MPKVFTCYLIVIIVAYLDDTVYDIGNTLVKYLSRKHTVLMFLAVAVVTKRGANLRECCLEDIFFLVVSLMHN